MCFVDISQAAQTPVTQRVVPSRSSSSVGASAPSGRTPSSSDGTPGVKRRRTARPGSGDKISPSDGKKKKRAKDHVMSASQGEKDLGGFHISTGAASFFFI